MGGLRDGFYIVCRYCSNLDHSSPYQHLPSPSAYAFPDPNLDHHDMGRDRLHHRDRIRGYLMGFYHGCIIHQAFVVLIMFPY